jgi:L-asparaginase
MASENPQHGSAPAVIGAGPEARRIVVLGTGGTIAGAAASATDNVGYVAAQRSVQSLLAAVPALSRWPLEAEQVAQLDSKDMTHATWAALARRCATHLARPEVAGLVVTHGTDTLEETAWLLHRVLGAGTGLRKPVVLTAAMRPATSLQADGPQNLLDAVTVAAHPGARGVVLAMAGQVWAGAEVRKVHTWRLEAFAAGDAGPLALLREGRVLPLRDWPHGPSSAAGWPEPPGPQALPETDANWPGVEIVASHAGAGPRAVQGLCAAGVQGLVVATTGNGSVHAALEAALREAAARGVPVLRASRCAAGGIIEGSDASGQGAGALPAAAALTPAQARVELMLQLLAQRA